MMTKKVNEFLFSYYKGAEELFADVFKPEWDSSYLRFPHFFKTMPSVSSPIFFTEVRRLNKDISSSLEDLSGKPKKLVLEIGAGFEDRFGCDESGNLDYRTVMKNIKKGEGKILILPKLFDFG